MASHECINGLLIEYPDPDTRLARFIEKVGATEEYAQALSLMYSNENPIMRRHPIIGSEATKETLRDPVYRVLTDTVDRKRISEQGVDVSKIASGYTLTVAEAAERLGAHESTVRKAIREGRLACWVKEGVYYLHPKWVEQFRRK